MMRYLYIRHPNVLILGEHLTATLLLTLTISVTVIQTYLWSISVQANNTIINFCLGRPDILQHILFDYHGLQATNEPRLVMGVCVMFIMTEIIIYILIFAFLYKHDKGMSLLLPERTIKQRNHKNVIELSGHFMMFVYKMLVAATFSLSTIFDRSNLNFRQIGVNLALCLGLVRLAQIKFSANLWKELGETLQNVVNWKNALLNPSPAKSDQFGSIPATQHKNNRKSISTPFGHVGSIGGK